MAKNLKETNKRKWQHQVLLKGQSTGMLLLCWWGCKPVEALCKNDLAVSCKVKNALNTPSSILLDIYPSEIKTHFIQKPAHKCLLWLYSHAKNWKQPRRPSTEEWISKLCLVHPISNEKNRSTNICNRDESQMGYTQWKVPDLKGYILYDTISKALQKKQN